MIKIRTRKNVIIEYFTNFPKATVNDCMLYLESNNFDPMPSRHLVQRYHDDLKGRKHNGPKAKIVFNYLNQFYKDKEIPTSSDLRDEILSKTGEKISISNVYLYSKQWVNERKINTQNLQAAKQFIVILGGDKETAKKLIDLA